MNIKIHQYNDIFIYDIRFWIETKNEEGFKTTWMYPESKLINKGERSTATGLLGDTDESTNFYYNGELNED